MAAVGENGLIITSPDGITWTRKDSAQATDLSSVIWTGKTYIALGSSNLLVSKDGSNWTPQWTPSQSWPMNSIIKSDNGLIAVGNNGSILTAPDYDTIMSHVVPQPRFTERSAFNPAFRYANRTLIITDIRAARDLRWSVLSLTGRRVMQGTSNGRSERIVIDVSQLPDAAWIFKVADKNGRREYLLFNTCGTQRR